MNSDLNRNDYEKILHFYNKEIPNSYNKLKKQAEDILANKLCRCIKKISKKGISEKNSIGICKKSVLKTKKINIYRFKCKKKSKLLSKKGTRKKLYKL